MRRLRSDAGFGHGMALHGTANLDKSSETEFGTPEHQAAVRCGSTYNEAIVRVPQLQLLCSPVCSAQCVACRTTCSARRR